MTESHRTVAKAFTESPVRLVRGSNVEGRRGTDGTPYLEGYGWAVYAARVGRNIVIYEDWRGYSVSTTGHMSIIERAARSSSLNVVYVLDERPQRGITSEQVMEHVREQTGTKSPDLSELGQATERAIA